MYDIKTAVDTLNFWIAKELGAYYTIQEIVDKIDAAQIAYFSDIKPTYARSQDVKDILSPFKKKYDFTPADTVSGYIVIPSNSNYLDLLDVQITYQISNRTIYYPVDMINEDERANRLNSQVDPVTVTSPIGEMDIPRYIRLYPVPTSLNGYTGTVTYFRRPIKPVYAYTTISQRVIIYDPINSIQLQWKDPDVNIILIKALKSLGINLTAEDVQGFAQAGSQENAQKNNNI